jgi:hypothetical protein
MEGNRPRPTATHRDHRHLSPHRATRTLTDMTLQALQVFFQAISSLGIAGGLIFTAIQFRRYRQTQHFANFTKLVEMQMHLREMRVTDPTLAEVYRHDVAFAQSQREIREYFFNLMQLSVFEVVWFGYKQGQVPEDYYLGWERRVREIVVEPSFQTMMASPSMKIMHDDFQRFITELMRETLATQTRRDAGAPSPRA